MSIKACVNVYLDDDVLDWVKDVAYINNVSVSAVIRDAVRNYRLALDDDEEQQEVLFEKELNKYF